MDTECRTESSRLTCHKPDNKKMDINLKGWCNMSRNGLAGDPGKEGEDRF